MKKTFAGILAVLMILCMGTTVFASTSPTAEEVAYQAVSNSASALAGETNVKVDKVSKEIYQEAVKETTGAIVSMAEIKMNNIANTDLSKGVSVTISVSTLTSDDSVNTIRIMHKRSSDGRWEIIVPTAVDPISKTVTLKLYDFSPVAIVRYTVNAPASTQHIPAGSVETPANTVYDTISSTLTTLKDEKVIKVTKVSQEVYEEAVKETTGAIVSMANISLNYVADTDLSKGVAVSVSVATLRADDSIETIRLLHRRSSDGKWEIIVPTSVNPATKTVSATFYDFSPVAVVRYAVGNAPASSQYIPATSVAPVNPDDSQEPAEDPYEDPDDYEESDDYESPDYGQNENSTPSATPSKKPAAKPAAKPAKASVATVHVSRTGSVATSPKTGSSLPALPIIAMFSLMGIAYCGKKAKSL